MNKKRNKKTNLSRPRSYRLNLELDNLLVTLANAAGVSPGTFTRIQMENILEELKPLVNKIV